MKKTICWMGVMAGMAAFGFTDGGKNLAPMNWMTLPRDGAAAMKAIPEKDWNFGFRKYGATSDMLWTDPKSQRDQLAGAETDKRTAALAATCDENGFTILVACTEPDLKDYLAKGRKFPSPMIEFFFAAGDADTESLREHCMCVYEGGGKFTEYAFSAPVRGSHRVTPFLKAEEDRVGGSLLVRMTYDWACVFDMLPLWPEKRDNFWRIGCIPYMTGGTWGGVVHQPNQAGYVRWPDFTPEQRLAVMRTTLLKGWAKFKAQLETFELGYGKIPSDKAAYGQAGYPVPDPGRYHAEKVAKEPRTYVVFAEDPDFRPIYEKLLKEREALGPQIGEMDRMDEAARRTFYEKASEMLFNFRADAEQAYKDYQKKLLMEGR